MLKELHEIDLNSTDGERRLRAALRDGFFFVRNTVPEALLDDAYQLLEAFFTLPTEVKQECRVPGSNGQSGYTPPLIETAEKGRVPDWKELFHWGVRLPENHPLRVRYPARYPEPLLPEDIVPGIEAVLTELHARMLAFQHEVASAVGRGLGVPAEYFAELLQDGPVVNRATWYPPMADAPSKDHVWAVEHQDFDLLTALPRATARGLQVQAEDGSWLSVDAPAGYAVVNVGMVLERLTDGLARAAVHRVVADPDQQGGRLSIVQFCHPAPWTVLAPLRIPGETEHPRRFPILTADDLFQRTMYRINRLGSR
ncbi:isopenicillin N synthase family dioxygenase [Kitasatospora sp. NPDC058190]|uniref:isopenicillin N synthase family dioxygenase n=1 Tax=Kitasatospora sp. NPDC058190 TaxID=3346371 RepID=UPI0036DB3CB1